MLCRISLTPNLEVIEGCTTGQATDTKHSYIFHDYQKILVICDRSSADVYVLVSEGEFPRMSFAFMKSLLQECNFLFVFQGSKATYTVGIIMK